MNKKQRQDTPLKQNKPQEAHAEVRPHDNKWVATTQAAGTFLILSKSFDTEQDAIDYANEFLRVNRPK